MSLACSMPKQLAHSCRRTSLMDASKARSTLHFVQKRGEEIRHFWQKYLHKHTQTHTQRLVASADHAFHGCGPHTARPSAERSRRQTRRPRRLESGASACRWSRRAPRTAAQRPMPARRQRPRQGPRATCPLAPKSAGLCWVPPRCSCPCAAGAARRERPRRRAGQRAQAEGWWPRARRSWRKSAGPAR
jgi:hypothetical protein